MTDDDNDEPRDYREATPQERDAQRLAILLQLPCLTVHDIAELLGMRVRTIWDMRYQGTGPRMFRIGRRMFVTRAAFDEWISTLDGKEKDD